MRAMVVCAGLIFAVPAMAGNDFPLSCHGWNGSITSKSGIDTRYAVIEGIVAKSDIEEYCERMGANDLDSPKGKRAIRKCIRETVLGNIGEKIISMADCRTGKLTFKRKGDIIFLKFPLADGTETACATGLPSLIEQFKILCPTKGSSMPE